LWYLYRDSFVVWRMADGDTNTSLELRTKVRCFSAETGDTILMSGSGCWSRPERLGEWPLKQLCQNDAAVLEFEDWYSCRYLLHPSTPSWSLFHNRLLLLRQNTWQSIIPAPWNPDDEDFLRIRLHLHVHYSVPYDVCGDKVSRHNTILISEVNSLLHYMICSYPRLKGFCAL